MDFLNELKVLNCLIQSPFNPLNLSSYWLAQFHLMKKSAEGLHSAQALLQTLMGNPKSSSKHKMYDSRISGRLASQKTGQLAHIQD